MLLKTHLDIISRNEPVQRKAKFWQSYMRALKGTDDMRAPESSYRPRSVYRPLFAEFPEIASKLDTWPHAKSIYEEPSAVASDRISTPGYRYQPISRETYGYAPRSNLARDFHYRPAGEKTSPEPSKVYDADWAREGSPKPWSRPMDQMDYDLAFQRHLDRMADIEIKHPRRAKSEERIPYALHRASPAPPRPPYSWRPSPQPPSIADRALGYTYAGSPIYPKPVGLTRGRLYNLLNPSPYMPYSRITRDPWWWDYPELRPFDSRTAHRYSPSYLRNSYLSPVKSTYLWSHHPIRPFYNGGVSRVGIPPSRVDDW